MILITFGTRPEYIKVKPLIETFRGRIPYKTLFTGQHQDIAPKKADFKLKMVDYPGNRLDSVIKNCLSIPDECFENITHVIVQGDTSSVVGLAIAAMHRKIEVVHLEAGLRTQDVNNPYPEEYNRKIVSAIASVHLCPTNTNKANLLREGVTAPIHVVGNTVLDNLLHYKASCEYADKVLVTMHRRENHATLHSWFKSINELAKRNKDLDFILPLHPNPNVQKNKHILSDVRVVKPMAHDELMRVLVKCRMVITDSGGLQEECSFFNKKCLVCRETTERPEAVNTSSFMVADPQNLKDVFNQHIKDYVIECRSPYGDGRSADRVLKILSTNFDRGEISAK